MATHIDATELLNLLESSEIAVTKQIKDLVHDNLNNSKEAWLVNSLVDFYIVSTSTNCIQILVNVTDPHDKHLLDKLNDVLKGSQRLHAITLLSHLVKKQPPWLHKIVKHAVLKTLLNTLKTDSDVPVLMSGLLFITALLPIVPVTIGHHLREIFDVFGRTAMFGNKKSENVSEVYMLHLRVGVYCLFNRLYGMYPCNFLTYLRNIYTREEHKQLFEDHIKPLLEWVRLHPHLVTSAKEVELSAARWRHKEVHDIVVDCSKLSVDFTDGNHEDSKCPVIHPTKYSSQSRLKAHTKLKVHDTGIPSGNDLIFGAQCSEPLWSPTEACRMSTPPPGSGLFTPGGTLLTPKLAQSSTPLLHVPKPTPSGLEKSLNSSNTSLNMGSNLKLQMPSGTSLSSQGSAPPSPSKTGSDIPLQAVKKIDFSIAPPDDDEEDVNQHVPIKKGLQQSESADSVASRKKFERMVSEDTTSSSSKEEKSVFIHNVSSLPNIVRRGSENTDILATVAEDAVDDDAVQPNESLSSSSTDAPEFPDHIPDNIPMTAESVAAFMRNVNRIRFNTINITKDRQHYFVNGSESAPHKRSSSCPNIELHRRMSVQEEQIKSESHVAQLKEEAQVDQNGATADVATSPVLCHECRAAATQTSLVSPAVSGAFISVTNITTDTTEELYIPYAHMFPDAMPFGYFPENREDNRLGTNLDSQSNKPPLYTSFTPTELLDKQILYGEKKHSHEVGEYAQTNQKKMSATQSKGLKPIDEVTHLQGQVLLLHSHLLFERHKRELHAKRNRRLLGKIVKTTALEEQNAALHDQLGLQEKEIQALHVSMKLLQSEHSKQLDSKQLELVHIDKQHRNLQEDKDRLLEENSNLKAKLELLTNENTIKAKELEAARAEIFNLQKELQVTKEKANQSDELQLKVNRLKHEALVSGEMQQRCSQQLTVLAQNCQPRSEMQLLIDSLKSDIQDGKHMLEQKTAQHHASKSRVMELEEILKNKELLIMEQKKCLEQTKACYGSQIKALEDKYCSQRQIQKSLQAELLVWQDRESRLQRGLPVHPVNPHGHGADRSRPDPDSGVSPGTGIFELHTPAPRSHQDEVFSFTSDHLNTPDTKPEPTPATPTIVPAASPEVVQGSETVCEHDVTVDLAEEADQVNLEA